MFISIERYGFSWLARPVVVVLLAMAVIGVVRPFLADVRRQGGIGKMLTSFQAPTLPAAATVHDVLHRGDRRRCWSTALPWAFAAKLVPMIVGTIALLVAGISLFNEMCRKPTAAVGGSLVDQAQAEVEQTIHADEKIHMDLESDTGHLPMRTIVTRSARFFGYLLAFMASMALIGLIPTAAVFVVVFMRLEGPERWKLIIPYVVVLILGIYVAFDWFMAIPWPPTLLG